ncbi:MAG: cupin domain-containing protein [Petrotogales bacterium]
MDKQGKIWGMTSTLFNKNNVEIHRIEVNAGGYCSEHRHLHKYNAFYIESGKMKIYIWKSDYNLCDETIVEAGDMTIVSPNQYHKFEALENTIAYEIYWVELNLKDIDRKNIGGMKES